MPHVAPGGCFGVGLEEKSIMSWLDAVQRLADLIYLLGTLGRMFVTGMVCLSLLLNQRFVGTYPTGSVSEKGLKEWGRGLQGRC